MAKIKISVVIPTFNRKKLLKTCLFALSSQTYPKEKFEIIVVDDGSTDSTQSLIKKLQKKNPRLRYLKQSHAGVFRARNLGIQKAQGEIIAFTDDDCFANNNWLEEIDQAFQRNPQALGIEGKTLTCPDQVTPLTSQIVNPNGGGYQTCNLAYKKRVLKKTGGLDEKFEITHCDDVDLALRVQKHGPIVFEPQAIVVHPPRKTTFKQALTQIDRIPAEFYLFLKHPDYFQERYGSASLFYQVVFKNSIWIRLFHLKLHSGWIRKNPWLYLKFLARTGLEIALLVCLVPRFWRQYQQLKQGSFSAN